MFYMPATASASVMRVVLPWPVRTTPRYYCSTCLKRILKKSFHGLFDLDLSSLCSPGCARKPGFAFHGEPAQRRGWPEGPGEGETARFMGTIRGRNAARRSLPEKLSTRC